MDPHRFDAMIQRLAQSWSRRSLVRGSLAAPVLAALGLDREAIARKNGVATEACIPTGRKCPSRRPGGRKRRKLRCSQCCQGFSIRGRKGKRKCSCKPGGQPCTAFSASDCCTGTCQGGFCASVSTGPQCLPDGADCDSDAECCGDMCNRRGSTTGPLASTRDTCVQCRSGRATCPALGDPGTCCGERECVDAGGSNRCCSIGGERCTVAPAVDTCCGERTCIDVADDGPDVCCSLEGEPCVNAEAAAAPSTCCTGFQCLPGATTCTAI